MGYLNPFYLKIVSPYVYVTSGGLETKRTN